MVQFNELLGSKKTVDTIAHFLEHPHQEYSQKEVAELVGLSKATAVQVFKQLVAVGFVKKRAIGPTNLYKLHSDHPLVPALHSIKQLLEGNDA